MRGWLRSVCGVGPWQSLDPVRLRRQRREHRPEQVDDRFGSPAQFMERADDVLAAEGLSVAERYMRHELQVWVGLRQRSLVDDDADYLIVYERAARPLRLGLWRWMIRVIGRTVGSADHRHCDDDAMLVDVVEVAKEVEPVRVPSVVRLYRVQNLSYFFGDCRLDGGESWGTPQSTGASPFDGKSGAGAGLPASEQDELVREMIEGNTEIVDRIACDGTPVGVGRRRTVGAVDMPSSLVVDFHDGFARAAWKNTPERVVEFCCMDVRPVYLDLDAIEIRLGALLFTSHATLACDAGPRQARAGAYSEDAAEEG